MNTYLFSTQPAMGHLAQILAIAKEMRSQGHNIIFAGISPHGTGIEKIITDNGFQFIKIKPAFSTTGLVFLPLTSGFTETFVAVKLFFSGLTHYAKAFEKIIDDIKPDAILTDFTFYGSCLAAEKKNIPYILIYHIGLSLRGPNIPPFASGLPISEEKSPKENLYRFFADRLERSVDRKISRARKNLGLKLAPKNYLTSPTSPWLTLMLTSEAIEAPRYTQPNTTFFIGPCISKNNKNDFPFDKLSKNKQKIYVSLGTVFNKKPKVFSKIINAFTDDKYQLIVSAGKAYEKMNAQKLPNNVLLFKSVPQVDVLPFVDVVISHGGNNTVNETLACGKPLLVMPVGGEQGDNASKVVYLGAGLKTDIRKSTSEEIKNKVNQLLEVPAFKKRAQQIAEELSKTQGTITATKFIEYIGQTKKPIIRPKNYPLTVKKTDQYPWDLTKNI